MFPKEPTDFFEGSIHLVYAIIAAQGFVVSTKIYIPFQNLFNYNGAISAFILMFVYFFLATAWFGFFKSTREFSYTGKTISIARYGTGLFNAFILYYMISLTSVEKTINNITTHETDYFGIFSLLPAFFAILALVHFIKYREYRHYESSKNRMERVSRKHLINTIIRAAVVCVIFIIQLVIYVIVIPLLPPSTEDNSLVWNPTFIITSFCITSWYRWHVWNEYIKFENRLKKPRKKSKSSV